VSFKVGDKVRKIVSDNLDGTNRFSVGDIKTVVDIDECNWVVVEGFNGGNNPDRLELVEEAVISDSALDVQIGGDHYKLLKIQPMQYALENNLNYAQANSIKYITRYKNKHGIEDLKKAIHCIELLIEHEEKSVD